MAALYDEEGNAVEGALSPDEVKALQEEKENISKEAADAKDRLAKLESKDMNFRRLEQMTEEDRAKLSAQEMELKKEVDDLRAKQEEFTSKQIEAHKNTVVSSLIGDDEELKEKILKNYNRIKDEAQSPEEISIKMREAYAMTVGTAQIANPLNVAMGYSGGVGPTKKTEKYSETADGKAFAKSLGMAIGQDNK